MTKKAWIQDLMLPAPMQNGAFETADVYTQAEVDAFAKPMTIVRGTVTNAVGATADLWLDTVALVYRPALAVGTARNCLGIVASVVVQTAGTVGNPCHYQLMKNGVLVGTAIDYAANEIGIKSQIFGAPIAFAANDAFDVHLTVDAGGAADGHIVAVHVTVIWA